MNDRIRFILNRISERLWVKPFIICIISVLLAFLAKLADGFGFEGDVPEVSADSIETLLTIISSSMLVIATFTVGSMLSAYSSVSKSATPRSFTLIISDDVTQNALSTFIGAFIFSIVGLIASMNGYYGSTGRFMLFLIMLSIFAIVVLNFLRWVDRIARLGRLGTAVARVEKVTLDALARRRQSPTLGAKELVDKAEGLPIFSNETGYVQRIEIATLQTLAEEDGLFVAIVALPGTFATAGRPLAYVRTEKPQPNYELDAAGIANAFIVANDRTFDEDPRFGLIVLSEIASRALSPAVNDPATAIDIIGTLVRIFTFWAEKPKEDDGQEVQYDRVLIPRLDLNDMFDDAFNPIARDGAGTIEVAIRLQKAFSSLTALNNPQVTDTSKSHAHLALRHAEKSLKLPEEIELLRTIFETEDGSELSHNND